jgi:hypothetical protein
MMQSERARSVWKLQNSFRKRGGGETVCVSMDGWCSHRSVVLVVFLVQDEGSQGIASHRIHRNGKVCSSTAGSVCRE